LSRSDRFRELRDGSAFDAHCFSDERRLLTSGLNHRTAKRIVAHQAFPDFEIRRGNIRRRLVKFPSQAGELGRVRQLDLERLVQPHGQPGAGIATNEGTGL